MAFNATTVFEVRSSGSDSNAGAFDPGVAAPGTDYSQQDAAQVAFTDLVIDGTTNTKVTSAAHPFDSTSPGNFINVTAGTGFTVQRVEILSVSGVTATCDKSLGTLGSTGGTGNLGGALATPGKAAGLAVASNTIYVKNGTYTCSSSSNVAGGCLNITVGGGTANVPFQFVGYDTTRTLINSDASAPVLQPAAAAAFDVLQFSTNSYYRVRNVKITNPSAFSLSNHALFYMNASYGIAELVALDAGGAASTYGLYQGQGHTHCFDCTCTAHTANGAFTSSGNLSSFHGCVARSGTGVGFNGPGLYHRCIAYSNTGATVDGFQATSGSPCVYINCAAHSNGRHGFALYFDGQAVNCVAVSNGGYGFEGVSIGNVPISMLRNCATFNNTSGATDSYGSHSKQGLITLTGDPFTSAAGLDFSPNNNAGQGAALRAAGWPASFATLSTSSYGDVGPAQHLDTSTTTIIPLMSVRRRTVVKHAPKLLPPRIIQLPGSVIPAAPKRMWSKSYVHKRRPPAILPGAAIATPFFITQQPRVARQRLLYPKRLLPAIVAVPSPPVVITKPPRIVLKREVRVLGRKPSFIGAPGSGVVVLEESTNVFRFDPGATSKSVYFKIRATADGQAKKSLTTGSAGANAGYVRAQGTSVNIPLVQLVTASDAWTSGGFIEVDPSNSPGVYRLDMPNAALAAGADFAEATLVFTNCFDSSVLIRLEKSTNNVGAGAIQWTVQTNNTATGLPLAGAQVWVTTDLAGTNTVAGALTTNAQGQAIFYLNAGTYYVWISDSGYTESNPTLINVA